MKRIIKSLGTIGGIGVITFPLVSLSNRDLKLNISKNSSLDNSLLNNKITTRASYVKNDFFGVVEQYNNYNLGFSKFSQDKAGYLYVNTNSGFYYTNGKTNTWTLVTGGNINVSGNTSFVYSDGDKTYFGKNNGLWVSNTSGGKAPSATKLNSEDLEGASMIKSNNILYIWKKSGLYKLNNNSLILIENVNYNTGYGLLSKGLDGSLYLGTSTPILSAIYVYKNNRISIWKDSTNGKGAVYQINNNEFYVASSRGLVKYNQSTKQETNISSGDYSGARITKLSNGTILIGSQKGIEIIKSNHTTEVISNIKVEEGFIFEAKDNIVYFGSNQVGTGNYKSGVHALLWKPKDADIKITKPLINGLDGKIEVKEYMDNTWKLQYDNGGTWEDMSWIGGKSWVREGKNNTQFNFRKITKWNIGKSNFTQKETYKIIDPGITGIDKPDPNPPGLILHHKIKKSLLHYQVLRKEQLMLLIQ